MSAPLRSTLTAVFLVTVALVSAAAPARTNDPDGASTQAAPSARPGESRLVQLIPTYNQVMTDTRYHALADQLAARPDDRAARDRLLEYMPLSPLDVVQIRMLLGRYELMVPPSVLALHRRWLELHPDQASSRAEAAEPVFEAPGATVEAQAVRSSLTAPDVGENRNAAATFSLTPDDYQGEIQVAVNPNNPSQIVAAANTFDNCGNAASGETQAVFYSSDGGVTWGYNCAPGQTDYGLLCNTVNPVVFGSDPAVTWDDSGTVYLEYMLVCDNFLGTKTKTSIVVASSADGGTTWSGTGVVKNGWGSGPQPFEDKNFYAIDRWPGSPYHGRHYTCWDRDNNEKSAWSSDGGATWHEVDLPSAPTGGVDLGCDPAVDSKGNVHVVFDTLTCDSKTCTNEEMYYTRSSDGGLSWSAPVKVAGFNLVGFSGKNYPDAQDSRGISPFGAVGVDATGGPCSDTLYATFGDFTANGTNSVESSDIWVSRSNDGGATWSQRVRVNDDGEGGPIQFHPFLTVDQENGAVVVAWHDARNDAANEAVDFYTARSLDCGQSFEANVKVSQPSSEFNNDTISTTDLNTTANPEANLNQYGEYLGLDVHAGVASLAWTDSRHYFPLFTTEGQRENLGFAQVRFDLMFRDGFETGASTRWSTSAP